MKTKIGIMIVAALFVSAVTCDAHEGKKHRSPVKGAIRELNEAKEILGKMPPDAEGHIAKATQAVDQAIQELSAAGTVIVGANTAIIASTNKK